jgi:cell division protein FtsW (lipid II flippase)
VAAQAAPSPQAVMLVVPALNAMFDIAATRNMAVRAHPPLIVYLLLGMLVLIGALFAGYGMSADATRRWLHTVGFALIMATTVYIILDYEFPRLGMIRVDAFDQALVEVQNSMK